MGGLVTLLIAVSSLFHTFAADHTIAGEAASGIFQQFNLFRLGLAATALLVTAGAWISDRSALKLAVFVLFALAVLAAVGSSLVLTPRIEHLRVLGLTRSAEFGRLHGMSMGVYLVETVLVFAAGVVLGQKPVAGSQ